MTGASKPLPGKTPSGESDREEVALASAIEVVGSDGAVARKFLALPFGNPFFGRDGRGPYILRDRQQAEAVIAATSAFLGNCEMMIDYDHQAHYAAEGAGVQAKAGGWVKALSIEDDGIHATVDWTGPAEAALAAREYRYVSPDFRVSKASREVTRLVRVSLTNSPNLDLPALASVTSSVGAPAGEEPDMKMISLAAVAAALALSGDPDEAQVIAAIGNLKAGKDGAEAALASVRKELSLADGADGEAVLASVQAVRKAGSPDPALFVPKAGYDELAARLGRIEEERIIASVDAAGRSGKLMPAMRQWAIDLGRKDEAALASYLAAAPAFAAGAQVKGNPGPEKGKLSDEEKAICSQLGLSEADFVKTRDQEEAA